jgi:hypothetical protein
VSDFEFSIPEASVKQAMPRVRFYLEAQEHIGKSAEAGRKIFVDKEMVSIVNPGSRDEFVKEVDDKAKQQFGPQYEHWRKTREELVKGEGFTPLNEAPFLRPSQIEELRHLNIVTIEMLAGLSEMAIQKVGTGARDLVAKAKGFLKIAADSAAATKLESQLAERDSEIATLKRMMNEMGTRFDAMVKEKNDAAPNP